MSDVVAQPEVRPIEDLEDASDFLKRHGMSVIVGVAAGLILVLGVVFFRARAADARRDAMMMLTNANTFDDLERVVSDRGSTPAAPLALLKLGQAHYAAGNYALAMEKYDTFRVMFAKHEMAPAAELGRLHAMEALGRTSEALAGFQAFAARQPDYFLAPQATFGAGRCLEQLGRPTEARVVYEQFIAAYPASPWVRRADEMLEQVNRRIARGETVAPPPFAESPAASDATAPFTLPGISAPAP